MTKRKSGPDRPEPTEKQKAAGDVATARVIQRTETRAAEQASLPRIASDWTDGSYDVGPRHSDGMGWTSQLTDALGLTDPRVTELLITGAVNGGFGPKPVDEATAKANTQGAENALAFVADMQPQNPVEAALVLQMAAAHTASMAMARHAQRAEMRDALADYSRMMNATMRTFTAQAEALHKLRTGGKQQVEVRYVYVDARTQTLVSGGSGQGGAVQFAGQPHAPGAVGHALAAGLPLWSSNPGGDGVSVAGREGPEPVSDARGQEPGGAQGSGERVVPLRTLDGGPHQGARPSPRLSEAS